VLLYFLWLLFGVLKLSDQFGANGWGAVFAPVFLHDAIVLMCVTNPLLLSSPNNTSVPTWLMIDADPSKPPV